MRLFISINLPDSFNGYFRELQGELSLIDADLKHAGIKSGFHLTLFFLGEVSGEMALKIAEVIPGYKKLQVGESLSRDSFKLKFCKKLGCFKAGDGVQSVFVDIDRNCSGYARLIELQKRVAEIVGKFGFVDSREFKPHITLCRVRACGDNFVDEVGKIEVAADEFVVDKVCLMESVLGEGGSEYREIAGVCCD